MASLLNPISSNTTSTSTTSTGTSSSSSANSSAAGQPSEQMFLQLLVSQLQNQDPLNPTDSTQFVSELAQFSDLEQVMAIRGDIEQYHAAAAAAASATTNPTQTGATGTGSTNGTTQP